MTTYCVVGCGVCRCSHVLPHLAGPSPSTVSFATSIITTSSSIIIIITTVFSSSGLQPSSSLASLVSSAAADPENNKSRGESVNRGDTLTIVFGTLGVVVEIVIGVWQSRGDSATRKALRRWTNPVQEPYDQELLVQEPPVPDPPVPDPPVQEPHVQ